MEHKAFLLDHEAFDAELRQILESSLRSNDCNSLTDFIRNNITSIRDPYEGQPVSENWESLIENRDPHQYGDFALTKYYDPKLDIGLGSSWETIQDAVAKDSPDSNSPILGSIVGTRDNPFDPGKMGSYFQSDNEVREGLERLSHLSTTQNSSSFIDGIEMLKKAVAESKGLYVTF